MENQTAPKLSQNKDFILVVTGQIVSLFGNSILRFALPLFILVQSGSSALFRTVMALSSIPLIIMSPIGGVIADRVNKKRIMVMLDFTTAAIVLIYFLVSGFTPIIPVTVLTLMVMFTIQGIYAPAVDSSVPVLVGEENLVRANSIVFLVHSLSMMMGPAIGGVLFSQFGLTPILIVSIISFALAAIMENFIRIPNVEHKTTGSLSAILKNDIGLGLDFIFKKQPVIGKACGIVLFFNIAVTPLVIIGVPVLVTQYMHFDESMLGLAQAFMGIGGLAGGILVGVLNSKLNTQKTYIILLIITLCFLPAGISFLLNVSNMVIFAILVLGMTVMMCISIIFNIQIISYIQSITLPEVLGKVAALVGMLALIGQPIGQFAYGYLFEWFGDAPWLVIFIGVISGLIIALVSRRVFKNVSHET